VATQTWHLRRSPDYSEPPIAGIVGGASITLGALTLVATGEVTGAGDNTGTAAITLGALTLVATGEVTGATEIEGTASITLGAVALAGTGTVAIAGTASVTLGALTVVGTGEVASSGNETETDTLIAEMDVAPDATREGHINDLIAGLKTDGVWDKLDVLWVLAAHDAQAARLNWKTPASFALTAVNSPTFTTDRGYAGNGTTSYLNTGWDPTNNGVNTLQNDAHIAAWNRTSRGTNNSVIAGAQNPQLAIYPRTGSGISGGVHGAGLTAANSDSSGLVMQERTGASATRAYRNGSSLGTGTDTSTGRPSVDVYIGGLNASGSFAVGTTDQCAAVSIGGSLNTTLALALYNRLQTYMTAVGA
jgi:hypothetical protein